jgi:hypothetical protein
MHLNADSASARCATAAITRSTWTRQLASPQREKGAHVEGRVALLVVAHVHRLRAPAGARVDHQAEVAVLPARQQRLCVLVHALQVAVDAQAAAALVDRVRVLGEVLAEHRGEVRRRELPRDLRAKTSESTVLAGARCAGCKRAARSRDNRLTFTSAMSLGTERAPKSSVDVGALHVTAASAHLRGACGCGGGPRQRAHLERTVRHAGEHLLELRDSVF